MAHVWKNKNAQMKERKQAETKCLACAGKGQKKAWQAVQGRWGR